MGRWCRYLLSSRRHDRHSRPVIRPYRSAFECATASNRRRTALPGRADPRASLPRRGGSMDVLRERCAELEVHKGDWSSPEPTTVQKPLTPTSVQLTTARTLSPLHRLRGGNDDEVRGVRQREP